MAGGLGGAEVFIYKYDSRMKTLVQREGLHLVRTFLSLETHHQPKPVVLQSSSVTFKFYSYQIFVNLSEDFSEVAVLVFP